MKQDYHQLLKPEIINSVSGLSLIARVVVDGFLSGLNASRKVGYGMEFSQYSHYQPGDDMRLLDWKLLARSGKYYIRKSEIETNVAVKFVLDSSNSMQHKEQGISKIDYARVLIASLAKLASGQGDEIGLYTINDKRIDGLYPRGNKQHLEQFLYKLINTEVSGKVPGTAESLYKIHSRSQKELIVFVSDMYESEHELTSLISGLKTSRNEVVVIHILGDSELYFDYKGAVTFKDLETGEKIKVDAAEVRSQYLQALDILLSGIKKDLLSNNISYHRFSLGDHIGEVLQAFLKQRNLM